MAYEPSEEFVAALQTIVRSAADFALHAGRDMARVSPQRHARMTRLFDQGLGELHINIQLSPEPQLRWVLQVGEREEVLFDSARGAPLPAPPTYR